MPRRILSNQNIASAGALHQTGTATGIKQTNITGQRALNPGQTHVQQFHPHRGSAAAKSSGYAAPIVPRNKFRY